jgi:uncharacterized membrane protein YedE/YeeE
MTAAAITLVIGFVVGYLGQRSRMCFVGAVRDLILVRDTGLFKGLIAFGLTAWLALSVLSVAGAARPVPFSLPDALSAGLTALGGLGLGYVSTLANGCPFRQHVLAAQGAISSIAYLGGFLAGAVVFHIWVVPALLRWLP